MKRCACYFRVNDFLNADQSTWLATMTRSVQEMHPGEVSKGQIESWRDCFDVLQRELSLIPEITSSLSIIFEYWLPQHSPESKKAANDNGVRADVILLDKKTVTILEFKRLKELFFGHVRQTRKYRRRIQDYHDQSRGMNKKAVLVLTEAENLNKDYNKVLVRSSDGLADALKAIYAPNGEPHPNPKGWIESAFSVHK